MKSVSERVGHSPGDLMDIMTYREESLTRKLRAHILEVTEPALITCWDEVRWQLRQQVNEKLQHLGMTSPSGVLEYHDSDNRYTGGQYDCHRYPYPGGPHRQPWC